MLGGVCAAAGCLFWQSRHKLPLLHSSPPPTATVPLPRPPRSCINTYGPEGRREPRAVAFAPGGRALLAAYPDGLRAFTLDPLQLCDAAEGLQWSKVRRSGRGKPGWQEGFKLDGRNGARVALLANAS